MNKLEEAQGGYPFEVKLAAVKKVVEEDWNHREVARLFGLSEENGRKTVRYWVKLYLAGGESGLMGKRVRKRQQMPEAEKSKVTTEELLSENQRLRMENEYLKKLQALALSRIESEKETKPE